MSTSWMTEKCLAAINLSEDELMESSSGGVFSILARSVICAGGVVYGHEFAEDFSVRCARSESLSDLPRLRGSKYVQSNMGESMRQIKQDLSSGKRVLFSGTPCQVDGLKAFLRGKDEGLLTVDIVCHGVPSPQLFRECMDYEFGDGIICLDFRDKREGWGCDGSATVSTGKEGKIKVRPFSPRTSCYYHLFIEGSSYRESCYRCPYAGGQRPGDLTIGDYWGLDEKDAGLNGAKGVSVVISNTERGAAALSELKTRSRWVERPLSEAVKGNAQLQKASSRPTTRDSAMEQWKSQGIESLERSFKKDMMLESSIWKLKRVIKNLIKRGRD